mgnify:CR=1 FL=1
MSTSKGVVHDNTITVYDAEIWGRENVYIFPPEYKTPRGVLWIIPPPSTSTISYKENPGFPGQHFAYDRVKVAIASGHIPQEDWLIVVGPTHKWTVETMAKNAAEIFEEYGFNLSEHLNLCNCCKDEGGKDYINAVLAMGDGANQVDFEDPTLTNVILVDPIIYPPIKIPNEVLAGTVMVNNPSNFSPTSDGGKAALESQDALKELLPAGNALEMVGAAFNHGMLLAGALAALKLGADVAADIGNLDEKVADAMKQECDENNTNTEVYDASGSLESGTDNRFGDAPVGSFEAATFSWDPELGICVEDPMQEMVEPIADPTGDPSKTTEDPTLTPAQGSSDYDGPQVIITSDRLVFNARTDTVLLSAGTHIGLSSLEAVGIDAGVHFTVNTPNIYLGLGAEEPLVLGQQMQDWCHELIDKIKMLTYTNSGGPTGPAINAMSLDPLKRTSEGFKSPQNYTL